jgi:hypothetical protein
MLVRSLLHSSLLLAGAVSLVHGADFTPEITPRVSVGVAKGFAPTQSDIDAVASQLAGVAGSSKIEYNIKPGVNIEVPVAINLRTGDTVSFIVAPALVYSQNNNDWSGTAGNVTLSGNDKYKSVGGKVYAGIGFWGNNGIHGELLPYVGLASVTEDVDASARNVVTGVRAVSSSSGSGTATLYGITLGGYYSPNPKGVEFGLRGGWVGSRAKIDGGNIEQSGGLIALELGYRL